MFDMVNLLTSGGPGSTTEVASITLKREGIREMAHRLFVGARDHSLRHRLWLPPTSTSKPQPGEAAMSTTVTAHSVASRHDWSEDDGIIHRRDLRDHNHSALAVDIPHRIQTPPDSIAYPPKILSEPSVDGYVTCLRRARGRRPSFWQACPRRRPGMRALVRSRNMVIGGPSKVVAALCELDGDRVRLDFLAVCFGTVAAYAFSRFRVPLADDLPVFHPVNTDDAADRGRDPDLPDVPAARADRHQARDPAVHRGECLAGGVVVEGIHG